MSFKKEDHPEYYARKAKIRTKNVTHSIHSWDEWCEICMDHGENPHLCFEITLDKGGGDYESFEYNGDVPKMVDEGEI